jgi:peptidoglycan/xylan/chitin deacetylase (PgdA/CDA1 family)/uncharacterized protein YgiM (DUF1202 family)
MSNRIGGCCPNLPGRVARYGDDTRTQEGRASQGKRLEDAVTRRCASPWEWLIRLLIVVALLMAAAPMLETSVVSPRIVTELGEQALAADTTFPVGSTVEVIDPDLYLRSAPGFSSTVLARMQYGTRGTILAGPTWANDVPWYQIRTTAYGTGWASGIYLRLVSSGTTPAPTSTPTGTLPTGSTIEVIDPGLYLRSAPGFASTVLARMALGTRGTVLGGPTWADGYVWYQIRTTAYGTGWASGRYLRLVPPGAPTPPPSGGIAIGATVETTLANLNLRSAPSLSASIVSYMALGTRGTVLAGPTWSGNVPWYQIRTTTYGTGWASGYYLRLASGSVTPTPTPIPTPPPAGTFPIGSMVEVIDPGLYLRSAPGISSTVLAHMTLGTRGTVLSGPYQSDGHPWYQIRTTAYGTGWASGRYLRLAGTSPLLTRPTDGLSRMIYRGVSGRMEIALTIDAGADRGYARQMLDVLKANGIRASFGITGDWARENPDLIERMVDEGHQILNHTWSHPSFTGVSASPALTNPAARKLELTSTSDYIYELTGYRTSPYWRPPYGDIDWSVRRDAYDAGYWQTVMWSIDSLGWDGASVATILSRCGYNAKAGDILLLHVGADSNDYAALQRLIDILESRGFSFVTVEQLLR